MGIKSTRENKNIYQISRENAELTREEASELMKFVSADRIEKIEKFLSLSILYDMCITLKQFL